MLDKLKDIVINFGNKYNWDCRYANIFELVEDINNIKNEKKDILAYCTSVNNQIDKEIDYIISTVASGDDEMVNLYDVVEYKKLKNEIQEFLNDL